MQTIQVDHAAVNRLRCIFDGKVVSLSFAADAAFGEVARTLGELSDQRYGNPVAIDVTLALPPAVRGGWPVA